VVGEADQDVMSCMSIDKYQVIITVWMAGSIATIATVAMAYGLTFPRSPQSPQSPQAARTCRIIVTDPEPPLNVRSSPVVATDNIVATINNGVALQVTGQQSGWLELSAPMVGWVYQSLTTNTCQNTYQPPSPQKKVTRISPYSAIVDKAQDRFQAGQVDVAVTLLQTVPAADSAYPQAQRAIRTMPVQWQRGKAIHRSAQRAMQLGQWRSVLTQAAQVPDIRYWRSRMAPLVKAAILKQAIQPPFTSIILRYPNVATTKNGTKKLAGKA
jgi:Bacterial SH3 domain